jgi:hypothetical protein
MTQPDVTQPTLTQNVRYLVVAEASPGLLPRLLQPFAKRDLTPDAMQARREGDMLRAEFLLHAAPAEMVALVAGNLGQVVGVVEVVVEQAQHWQQARIAA